MTLSRLRLLFVTAMAAALILAPGRASALSLIRDAETESIIRLYATPLFQAANLNPDSISIFIVQDPTLNAFVAGGQNMFIHTGLLLKVATPEALIGVMAHETGHIAHGDLSRTPQALESATAYTILGAILGGAAAVAGRPDVGAAVFAGSSQAGLKSFLQFTRTQESAADQAAVRLLDLTHQSARGLLAFMETMENQELLGPGLQDPYMRTHPITRERIEFLSQQISKSPYSDAKAPTEIQARHDRMRAKLAAFLNPPSQTLRTYGPNDKSVIGRYARAVALYRKPDTSGALKLMDELIAERPDDGFFQELKGQILFESGHAAEAVGYYEQSVRLVPDAWQLYLDLARAEIESNEPGSLEKAIENLKISLHHEPNRSFAWRQLAIAYGRLDRMGETSHALAEEALLQRRYREAIGLAERALKILPTGSPAWLRSEDIVSAARYGMSQEKQRR